ncbi:MAG TPA: hypothetical protein VF701_08555 [Thermoanaerobaculia bacterium]
MIEDLLADGLPPNEYDDYAPYIVGMLQRGATRDDLIAHLRYCRTGAIGLDPNDSADTAVANEIYGWWQQESLAGGSTVG